MTDKSKFKILQDIYVSKKLSDDAFWMDLVEDVKSVLEQFSTYLGMPDHTYTSDSGKPEHYLKVHTYHGEKRVPLKPSAIEKRGHSFDFQLELSVDSAKSDNARVSETVFARVSVQRGLEGKLAFYLGSSPKQILIDVRDPTPFFDAVFNEFKSEFEKPISG